MGQRKEKRLFWVVSFPFLVNRWNLPAQRSESSDFFVELSKANCQSVRNTIALLVEFLRFECIVRGSVKQQGFLNGFIYKKLLNGRLVFLVCYDFGMIEKVLLGNGAIVLVAVCFFGWRWIDFIVIGLDSFGGTFFNWVIKNGRMFF